MNTYGTLTLLDASPAGAFDEPLSLADVRRVLNLPERSPSNPEEDIELEGHISAARDRAEQLQGRDLVRKHWELSLDYWPCNEIELRAPLVSVELVKYRDSDGNDTTLVQNTDYIVDTKKQPGIIMPPYNDSWPSFTAWPSSAITIYFTSGYESDAKWWDGMGAQIKRGMLLLISEWWNNRLPFSYDISAGGNTTVDRIRDAMSAGALTRIR